jgi:hypothetical protein
MKTPTKRGQNSALLNIAGSLRPVHSNNSVFRMRARVNQIISLDQTSVLMKYFVIFHQSVPAYTPTSDINDAVHC